ncbi:MAG TPA: P pilus assembly/Cpx signaling pathway, periplasmic inhibitor/zinc-resistance associated protein [Nostocaceae cyanobacterium]|nr:P pilus assembly/Cpx signaling pathway, periplasmic inhibitor/zinc-resistance associated protein [Nostocaceae cyanobacterium]
MQLKKLALIAGAVALTLTATPFTVQAQTTSSRPLLAQQAGKKGPWQELGLTDAQKQQIKQINQNTRAQIEAVFTPEQRAKLQAAKQARGQGQRQRGKEVWQSLNLTDAQKAQIRQIKESSQKQITAVLTPEQQAKLQQLRQNWQQRRQQRNAQ